MTDDDDDERMDRARRIRRMREGHRGDDGEDTNGSGTTDDAETAEATTDDAETAEATTDETENATEEATAGGAETGTPDEAATTDGKGGTDMSEVSAEAGTHPDDWFDETDTSTDTGDGGSATPEPDIRGSVTTDSTAQADTDTKAESDGDPTEAVETASSAAQAAAAFEVDEDELDESASDDAQGETETEAATETEPQQEAEIRVLEFRLGDERYCLDIMHVEEIVKKESVTRVPNTPPHVHGVVDLRGQITTILDPKVALDIEGDSDEQLLIVFDGETFEDQGHAGWIVDEVRQVLPVTESEVKESPIDRKEVKGVIERDDEFVIWTKPRIALGDQQS